MLRLRRSVKADKNTPQLRSCTHSGRKMRHELKFIINEGTRLVLLSRLAPLTYPDPHGEAGGYRVTSLYFDDIYGSGYLDKINGLETRRKFRVRAYGLDPSRITLEAKHKDGEFVSKLSDRLTREQYEALLHGDCSFMKDHEGDENALGEFYRSDRLTALRPRVIVDYRREALVYPFGNVRITFDKKLSTCYNSLDMFDEKTFYSPIYQNEIILEVKFDDYLPDSVSAALQGLNAPRMAVSKYIICCDRMTEVKSYGF